MACPTATVALSSSPQSSAFRPRAPGRPRRGSGAGARSGGGSQGRAKPLFFQLVQYSSRADAQHSCGIAHLATIEAQIYHLLFDLGRAAFVGGVEQEGLVGAVGIVAAIALFSGVGLAPVMTWLL